MLGRESWVRAEQNPLWKRPPPTKSGGWWKLSSEWERVGASRAERPQDVVMVVVVVVVAVAVAVLSLCPGVYL